jgi:hypothetical protein
MAGASKGSRGLGIRGRGTAAAAAGSPRRPRNSSCRVRPNHPTTQPPNHPPGGAAPCAYVFGGAPQSGPMLADLWRLDLAAWTWTQLQPRGAPPQAGAGQGQGQGQADAGVSCRVVVSWGARRRGAQLALCARTDMPPRPGALRARHTRARHPHFKHTASNTPPNARPPCLAQARCSHVAFSAGGEGGWGRVLVALGGSYYSQPGQLTPLDDAVVYDTQVAARVGVCVRACG